MLDYSTVTTIKLLNLMMKHMLYVNVKNKTQFVIAGIL